MERTHTHARPSWYQGRGGKNWGVAVLAKSHCSNCFMTLNRNPSNVFGLERPSDEDITFKPRAVFPH